jgi:hypothetical protein
VQGGISFPSRTNLRSSLVSTIEILNITDSVAR